MLTDRSRKAIVTCSALAIATVLTAGPRQVQAQVSTDSGSFQGIGTPLIPESASISAGSGTTTITVNAPQAVIDWTTFDTNTSNGAPIIFQPDGTTATFQSFRGGDYAVLNRIVPTDTSRPVQFNGTVNANAAFGSGNVFKSTVFFYSPGGVILGPTAAFNVGNLGLTSAAPVVAADGTWINGNVVEFQQAVSGTRVEIQGPQGSAPGARITAANSGSYVAAFAPVVNQAGTIDVNGSAALVAGEAGTITFSPNGLFDIQVTTGSTGDASGVGIRHQGSTGGPANTGSGTVHRVYLVAIPKNQLLTMAIERGSRLGFDIAGAADVVGNAVVLSAGHNVSSGFPETAPINGANGRIVIDDSSAALTGAGIDFTSATYGQSSGDLDVQVVRQTTFASDADFSAPALARITVDRLGTAAAGTLTVNGALSLSSDRDRVIPGFNPVANVDGGQARIRVFNGGTATVAGDIRLSARATVDNDGDGLVRAGFVDIQVTGAGSTLGGAGNLDLIGTASSFQGQHDALGANVAIVAGGGGSVTIAGDVFGDASGRGAAGALGTGNFVSITANNGGTIALRSVDARANGASGGESSSGGAGMGGTASLNAIGSGTLTVTGDVLLAAEGRGEFGGGTGTGGLAQINVQGGTVTVGGLTELSADGGGGSSFSSGTAGGLGKGGSAQLLVSQFGGTINLADADLHADGLGGDTDFSGAAGGAGTGGDARILFIEPATPAPGAVNITGDFLAFAQGVGGNGVDCSTCTVEGGIGTGGNAVIAAAAGKTVTIAGVTELNAAGFGGDASDQAAGAAFGGTARVTANGATIGFGGNLTVDAGAFGGTHVGGGRGGDATGGMALVQTSAAGGSITVAGDALILGDAAGGDSVELSGLGTGGNATGNAAQISSLGGSMRFDARVVLSSGASGGDAGAVGGNATGGSTEVNVDGVGAGGTVSVAESLGLDATGFGGDGFAAGDGTGGEASIETEPGTLTLGDGALTTLLADGTGAAGIAGGSGGDGTGGMASIFAGNSTDGTVSNIALHDAIVSASGFGGAGAAGVVPGQAGGAGGAGEGGRVEVAAGAGIGTFVADSVVTTAIGIGGAGGNGAAGTETQTSALVPSALVPSAGGAGGAGGSGTGGLIFVGIESGDATPTNSGSADLGAVTLHASGTGGAGGAGGTGTTMGPAGVGGAGGAGSGGGATLLAEGASLTVTTADIRADGVGGTSAGGAPGGIGTSGSAGVRVTNRVGLPGVRGSLTADDITVSASADGSARNSGGRLFFEVLNSDATIGSADLVKVVDSFDPAVPDTVLLRNGTVEAGSFRFFDTGLASVQLDDGDFNVGSLTLAASDFVLPDAPAVAGTFNISESLTLATDQDFVTYANITFPFDFTYEVPGAFQVGNYSSDGNLRIDAGGPVTFNDISVANLDLLSGQDITTGAITASGNADLEAEGSIVTGDVVADGFVDMTANSGSLVGGAITAGLGVGLEAGTTLTAADITAGIDPDNGFSIGVAAGDDVNLGNLDGPGGIGLLSQTGSITAADVDTDRSLLALASDAVSFGRITAGTAPGAQVYIANASLAPLGGPLDSFNPAPIFAAAPVATGGPIAITGPITGGLVRAVSAGTITTRAITAAGLGLGGAAGVATGALSISQVAQLASTAGSITATSIDAGAGVSVFGNRSVSVGNVSAGIVNPSTAPSALYNVTLASQTGPVTAGTVAARNSVAVLARGDVTLGRVTTGTQTGNVLYIADSSLLPLGVSTPTGFDVRPVFAADRVRTAGSITIAGPVTTGNFIAAAGTGLTVGTPGAVDAPTTGGTINAQSVVLEAGGPIRLGDVSAIEEIEFESGGAITAGNLRGDNVELLADGAVRFGTITADFDVELESGGTLTGGTVMAGDEVVVQAAGSITLGDVSASLSTAEEEPEQSVGLASTNGSVTVGNVSTARDIGILAGGGSITAGTLTAGRDVLLLARQAVSVGAITAAAATGRTYIGNASQAAGADLDTFNPEPIFAATPVATGGAITIAGPVTTGSLRAASGGALTIGRPAASSPGTGSGQGSLETTTGDPVVARTRIELTAAGALTAGDLTAGDSIDVQAGGAIMLGNLSAGLVNPATGSDARLGIGVASTGGGMSLGNVAAARRVGLLAGGGNLSAGTIGAGSDVLLLERDEVSVGAITAPATGQVYVANASMLPSGTRLSSTFDPAAILAATPVATTGAITLRGPASGSAFTAAAGGNFTAPALTFGQRINVARAATANVNGAWVAPTINVASQRIAFAAGEGTSGGGSLGANGTTTAVNLRALASGQQAVLGGTADGTGYTLKQSDFGRIRTTGSLTIQVDPQGISSGDGGSSSARDLEIRNLTLNGSAGSGPSTVTIATSGSARVVGDLLLAQAGADDTLNVAANQRLEIVLPEGSIAITGAGGGLAGTLTLSSNNLVAGTLDVLQQALADPEAAGLATALRTPSSTTPDLEGYIRAEGVNLLSNANILLQNSGTARDFAGVTVGGDGLMIGRITPMSSGGTGTGTGDGTGTGTGGTATSGFSFVGMLMTPNDVLIFDFSVDASSTVTLRTYSYAGGTNAAGQTIARGGFDPILSLYNSSGARIAQNDDGGGNVPADAVSNLRYDTFLTQQIGAGSYKVAVTVFPNFAPANINGTFEGATSFADTTGALRTPNFAFDVLGAQTATGPGSQGGSTPNPGGPLNVVAFGRQVNPDGTVVTGRDFFARVDFGRSGENPVLYTDTSEFNTCIINAGQCGGLVPFPPGPDDPGTIAGTAIRGLVRGAILEEEPFDDTAEEDDEARADEARSPIAPPAPLIDTRPLNPAVDVVEPVSGSGNPALIGSAVNETATQETQP